MTKPTEPSQPALGPTADGLDFEIEDTTPTEVVEQERRFLAGQPADAEAEEPAPTQSEAPQPTGEAPKVEPAPQPVATAPTPVQPPAAPPVRTFSQEEVSKMQAAWMRQIESERKTAREASEQVEKFNLDATVEATLRQQERQLAPDYGEDEARKIVRTPGNAAVVREATVLKQQVAQEKAARESEQTQAEQNAKLITANLLMQRHSLPADDFDLLINAGPPDSMVKLARRLATQEQAKSTTQAQKAMRDRVPPETPETRLETGTSTASGKRTVQQEIDRIMDKPSWQWTPQEHDFFTRNR